MCLLIQVIEIKIKEQQKNRILIMIKETKFSLCLLIDYLWIIVNKETKIDIFDKKII